MRRFTWPILIIAILFGLLGVVYFGYAAAEHYGWDLRRWLILSLVSAGLLLALSFSGSRRSRIVALIFLALLVLGSLSPAYRIAHVGLLAP